MKIWIDITNSPHVLFFEPIIKKFKEDEHDIIITSRDFAQTLFLLKQKNIKFKKIGKHGGKNKFNKIFQMIKRDILLFLYLFNKKIDIALGHASYDSAIIGKLIGAKTITTFDYEYAETIHKVLAKFVDKFIVPIYLEKQILIRYGIEEDKIFTYEGLKEEIYLKEFKPDFNLIKDIINKDKINLLIRPPALESAYYNNIKHILFFDIMDYFYNYFDFNKYNVIVIPRTKNQLLFLQKKYEKRFKILVKTYDGPQLIYWSDYVISAGGTMIREAAVLNTKAITITDLKIGGVDKYLIKQKKLYLIKNIEDIKKINFKKNKKNNNQFIGDFVFNQFMEILYEEFNKK